jgi:hypothetical protein
MSASLHLYAQRIGKGVREKTHPERLLLAVWHTGGILVLLVLLFSNATQG